MNSATDPEMTVDAPPVPLVRGPKRYALILCGWSNVALGMIGAVVPGIPYSCRNDVRRVRWLENRKKDKLPATGTRVLLLCEQQESDQQSAG